MSEPAATLEGALSIRAALESESREIFEILVDESRRARGRHRRLAALLRRAEASHIPIRTVDREEVDALASGRTHGGVLARVGPRRTVGIETLGVGPDAPFVVMLDGVEDPHNFGQALRALGAAGADGLVLRPRNWMSAAAVVARASAGLSERLPVAIADSADEAAAALRARGLRVAVAAREHATPLYESDLSGPLFLVVGGEKRGVTRSFRDAADLRLTIPYATPYPISLGVAAAATVIGFEVMRQRRVARNQHLDSAT